MVRIYTGQTNKYRQTMIAGLDFRIVRMLDLMVGIITPNNLAISKSRIRIVSVGLPGRVIIPFSLIVFFSLFIVYDFKGCN